MADVTELDFTLPASCQNFDNPLFLSIVSAFFWPYRGDKQEIQNEEGHLHEYLSNDVSAAKTGWD